ncbi:hypothetical protein [Metabacillus idriensis]|uniref:hypothetical protein n=1 Tax=Metabacillus idriensis TaxID=324768 RepID=UPI001748B608|nr:hypothetical protein [Metabacillus idriensis]
MSFLSFHCIEVKTILQYSWLSLVVNRTGIYYYLYFTTNTAKLSSIDMPQDSYSAFLTMALYSSLVFVQYISDVSASADMVRYAITPKRSFFGLYAGNLFGFFITVCLGSFSAFYFQQLNPFITASSLTATLPIVMTILQCSFFCMLYLILEK